jgi:hypothetical protein
VLRVMPITGCDMKSPVWLLRLDNRTQPGVLPPVLYRNPRLE